jgi:hypothetical protein
MMSGVLCAYVLGIFERPSRSGKNRNDDNITISQDNEGTVYAMIAK